MISRKWQQGIHKNVSKKTSKAGRTHRDIIDFKKTVKQPQLDDDDDWLSWTS
jgi:hypothetical protein